MKGYRLHREARPRKATYTHPHGVSNEETALAKAIQLGFPRLPIYRSNREILGGREIDIWIPSYSLGIEFNGNRFHSSAMDKDRNYHLNKTILAERRGVSLLHIFSDMWETRPGVVLDTVFRILGRGREVDPAVCTEADLSEKEARTFIDRQCLRPSDPRATMFIGYLSGNVPIAVLEYSENTVYGYHEAMGLRIRDGLQNLLENKGLWKLRVYGDRGLLEDRPWKELGYSAVGCTEPRLWYTEDFKRRIPSWCVRLDENKTKSMYTIYDCGELIMEKGT